MGDSEESEDTIFAFRGVYNFVRGIKKKKKVKYKLNGQVLNEWHRHQGFKGTRLVSNVCAKIPGQISDRGVG